MTINTAQVHQTMISDLTYYTGLEVFNSDGTLDLDRSIEEIQNAMYRRNPDKNGDFINTFKQKNLLLIIMGVPHIKERMKLFQYMYYAMRLLDDICDDDLEKKLSQDTKLDISYKAAGETTSQDVFGLYDALLDEILYLSSKIGMSDEIRQSISMIAKSLKFDFDRSIDKNPLRTKQDLENNFDMMDIIGTEYGTAIILGLNPDEVMVKLKELGIACRIGYNIMDLVDDIYKNLINISKEELEKFGITSEDLSIVKDKWKAGKIHNISELLDMDLPNGVEKWLHQEVSRAQQLVQQFKVKYSIGGILFKGDSIPALYKQSYIRRTFNNLIIRIVVLPKIYLADINSTIA